MLKYIQKQSHLITEMMNRAFAISIACIIALFGVNLVTGDVSEIRSGMFYLALLKFIGVSVSVCLGVTEKEFQTK